MQIGQGAVDSTGSALRSMPSWNTGLLACISVYKISCSLLLFENINE